MSGPDKTELAPWIERLVLSYSGPGEEEPCRGGGSGSGCLKAHVVGLSQMSQSQVLGRGPDGPIGLIFLSDGVLQIPAVLTAAAWEHVQEQEEREDFSSFLHTTVFVRDYRLRFYMNPELTKCRFLLSVGQLATFAVGSVKDSPPCCTSLASVQAKICRTWMSLQAQEDSRTDLCELSEMLDEWQDDSLQLVLKDVQNQLRNSSLTQSTTSWDVDRIRYRGQAPFVVPGKLLQIPEGSGTRTQRRAESVEDVDWQVPDPAGAESVRDPGESSPVPHEDDVPQEDMTDRPLSNPWDMFPPPCITSSTEDSSPEPTPNRQGVSSGPDSVATATVPSIPSTLPPYQDPQTRLPVSSSLSSDQSPAEPPSSDGTRTPAVLQTCHALDRDQTVHYRKPKRKRCDVTPEQVEKRAGLSQSPPSWLFETQTSRTKQGSSPKQAVPRRTPSVHRDGTAFSYTYTVTGQNLLDCSRFRVEESVLRWALRTLLTPEPCPDIS
ncbi:adrenocortical dysplasia protein homolog [Kryptolebias marmoratus]|uniref:adrenocortical dysplasia protein homolog n=1 Tax=Kryptolebias marmoratus TaxID=37003 RepID=UPI0007F86F0D|nr:adrenocortical dysplasia protein homolog [Kryptolebias marmoratus]